MKRIRNICLIIALLTLPGLTRERMPRELVPPAEMCSINGQLEFQDAMSILSEYSITFTNKPIFDPTKQQGPIGVDINGMQWEKALQIILSSRGLWYDEMDHFLQIVVPSASKGSGDDDINVKLGSREIKIETIFFEGDRTAISEIGIDWSTFYNGSVKVSGDQLGSSSITDSFLNFEITSSESYDIDVRALFSIFDSRNIGKVLAQPQVVVTQGNEGKIQVGEDFSIKTTDFAGNVIDRFFSTGTIMEVTPYLLQDKDDSHAIVLKVHVERSQAAPDAVSTIVKKSEADSYIQLFDGEETIIAGLYNTEKNSLRKGVPIIKDLPGWFFGLSYIFGYNREEVSQKELIIIIKATILPSVFDRKDLPVNQDYWDDDAELKVRPYQRGDIEPVRPEKQIRSVYSAPPIQKQVQHQAIESNRIVQQPRSASVVETKPVYNKRTTPVKTTPRATTQAASTQIARSQSTRTQTASAQTARPQTSRAPVQKKIVSVPKSASQSSVQTADAKKNYFLGQIVEVDDNIILIKWQGDFNTDKLNGKRFSVIRSNGSDKPLNVGNVLIRETKYERSIGRRIQGAIRPGDMVVVKFSSNV